MLALSNSDTQSYETAVGGDNIGVVLLVDREYTERDLWLLRLLLIPRN